MAAPPPIVISDLTDKTVDGAGAFDTLMSAVKAHTAEEFNQQRIRGAEYSNVYLGALQTTLDRALEFLLTRDKLNLELAILDFQRQQAEIERDKATAELGLINAQKDKALAEINLVNSEIAKADAEKLRIDAQTTLITEQGKNAITEGKVLVAQECKLRAEFDLIMEQVTKVTAETSLLNQKVVTETAQTNGVNVDADSVIGKQITLYGRQADGFVRDAEQKAAKLLADTWSVRRTTDEAVPANSTNQLDDTYVGRAVAKLLEGVNA